MKKSTFFAALLVAALAGCANPNGDNLFGPKVASGNQNYVVISDPIGLPGGALKRATAYCANYGKTPMYQGPGGDAFDCVGTQWCTTYACK